MTQRTRKSCLMVAIAGALAAFATQARADAPGALELGIGTGFTRGHGPGAGGMMPELQDLAGNGATVRLDVGWRVDPRWMVGTYVEVGGLSRGEPGTDGMTSVGAGIQGQLHLAPAARFDPWLGLGAGWRGLWVDHAGGGTHALQGVDLARVQLGVDYRMSDRLALAPSVGLAFTEMLSEKAPGASAYSDVADRKVGHFLFAGVSGRFGAGAAPDRR